MENEKKQKPEKEILASVADAIVQHPVKFRVDVYRGYFGRLWRKLWKKPNYREFEIRPVTLGTLVRISRLLISIDIKILDMKNLLESNYVLLEKHAGTLAHITALAIHNKKTEVPQELVDFIMENFTTRECLHTITIVLDQMDVGSFMHTIILAKGALNQLASQAENEMSQKEQGSLIASGELSVAL